MNTKTIAFLSGYLTKQASNEPSTGARHASKMLGDGAQEHTESTGYAPGASSGAAIGGTLGAGAGMLHEALTNTAPKDEKLLATLKRYATAGLIPGLAGAAGGGIMGANRVSAVHNTMRHDVKDGISPDMEEIGQISYDMDNPSTADKAKSALGGILDKFKN